MATRRISGITVKDARSPTKREIKLSSGKCMNAIIGFIYRVKKAHSGGPTTQMRIISETLLTKTHVTGPRKIYKLFILPICLPHRYRKGGDTKTRRVGAKTVPGSIITGQPHWGYPF
jgi:hypothetical protein